MFSTKEYFDNPFDDGTFIREIDGEKFKLRRLDGIDMTRMEDMTGTDERVINALSRCLYDGESDKLVTREDAIKFIRRYHDLAVKVFLEIVTLTSELQKTEFSFLEEARKNSKATDTLSAKSNSAKDTVSTQEKPKSAEKT